MERRWLIVSNSSSGSADESKQKAIVQTLQTSGPVKVVAPSSLQTFDAEVRRAARGADVIIAAGGDGTMNSTLNAIGDNLGASTLALVPMGTGNDLARTLGISDDPVEAAKSLTNGVVRELDVARASGPGVQRLFLNACMGGFPVEANEAIDEDVKKRFGPLAFWVGGAKALKELTKSTVTINGVRIQDCIAAGVGNGRTCGGGMEVWPTAQPDDGNLNGCVLAASSIPESLALAARVKAATHEDLDHVETIASARIEIHADPEIQFNVDGELIGLKSPATFEIVSSVRFLVPA